VTKGIEVFTQNSIRIQSEKGMIYVDPFQMREEPKDAAYIFVTHEHYDHFSPEDVAKVCNGKSVLIVPESMAKKAAEISGLVGTIMTVKPEEGYEANGLKFETVRAYNVLKPFHPKGKDWVGYVIEVDGKRVYVAGDTDATKEAKAVRCDVALIPIGGTYTMDAKKAAELVNEMRPVVVIPTHYGKMVGSEDAAKTFEELVTSEVKVEIKKQF